MDKEKAIEYLEQYVSLSNENDLTRAIKVLLEDVNHETDILNEKVDLER